jgi:outer membrane protein OmpU
MLLILTINKNKGKYMNIKKIGLTALAGSLIATTTGFAGEVSISGAAKLSYKDIAGTANVATTEAGVFAMDQELTASGSAELDNGMTISLSHGLAVSGGASDTSSLTLDMGDMGSITYNDTDLGNGLRALKDKTPSAYEDAIDGITGAVQAAMATGQGFAYNNTFAGAAVSLVYSDNLGATADRSDGGQDTTSAGASSSSSIGVTYPVLDLGLTVYGGVGSAGQADGKEHDHNTLGATYAFGPMTINYQRNGMDDSDNGVTGAVSNGADLTTHIMGVSFMVNDNLSVSYAEHDTATSLSNVDQEAAGFSIAYSMGGMTLSAYHNEADNAANVSGSGAEATEILLSFAF